ncbi:hypothetical protein [Streptomyces sp. AHA2]|uniref:hypothetical protein n=1 Tax=Streptomyces sp. AHA2 TaxID=3064526 RepID=UPI002FE25BBA
MMVSQDRRDAHPHRVIAGPACSGHFIAELPVIALDTDSVIARVPVKSHGGRAVAFTPDNNSALLKQGLPGHALATDILAPGEHGSACGPAPTTRSTRDAGNRLVAER